MSYIRADTYIYTSIFQRRGLEFSFFFSLQHFQKEHNCKIPNIYIKHKLAKTQHVAWDTF